MKWYYALNNQSQGPVSPEDLASLLSTRSLTPATLVWREGLPNWVPLSTIQADLPGPASAASAPVPPMPVASRSSLVSQPVAPAEGTARCGECNQFSLESDMIVLGGMPICAHCKPIYLQKLREGVRAGGNGFWRKGRQLVVGLNTAFPSRCVKCDAETSEKRLKRSLYWHNPLLYAVIIFPGLLIYLIIAMCVRKTAVLHVALCDQHRTRRKIVLGSAWLLFFLGLVIIFIGAAANDTTTSAFIGTGIFVILGALIFGTFGARVIYAKKIDKEHAFVGGVCREFLEKLPEWS